ncbi:MAG: ATP-binding cassette domain-containing protein [Saprospiraceae bacterium]|nr:ATP-binding cassette domain-containing protein [Saprospiraceae bacterium]
MEIEIDQISKRFQHGWVFKNLSHQFKSDGMYGIAGRNGSGKSTFLKIISGLLTPTSGTIRYANTTHTVLRETIYQYINIAAPYIDLIEEFTLEEMVQFHMQFRKTNFKQAGDWIELMELKAASKRLLNHFSSGMKQRVRLALALYSPGEILILDEPTSNLDEDAKAWFFNHLELQKRHKTVLIASNEKEDFKFCSEILRLDTATP